jgi:hypothetical protein
VYLADSNAADQMDWGRIPPPVSLIRPRFAFSIGYAVSDALAHAISDKTEAAYRRGDLFEKRRKLMETWASYVTDGTGMVVPLRAGVRGQ